MSFDMACVPELFELLAKDRMLMEDTVTGSAESGLEEKVGGAGVRVGVEMRAFRAEDAGAFCELNEDWITKNFKIETQDRKALDDAEGYILRQGGHIFMAVVDGVAVGCCALLLMRPGVFEVGKMTVAEAYRGMGIGRKMLEYTIVQGKALGAESLYLETNTKLTAAIHLYEAAGFRHLPPERVVPSPYVRANVFMELIF
jgi:putative acetyltransferase